MEFKSTQQNQHYKNETQLNNSSILGEIKIESKFEKIMKTLNLSLMLA